MISYYDIIIWYQTDGRTDGRTNIFNFLLERIALKLLVSTITRSIWGINPNNQSIWLGHVKSWWILIIKDPSYKESDHFRRIFAYPILHSALGRLYCARRRFYCALRRLYCALRRLYCALAEKYVRKISVFPYEIFGSEMWKFVIHKKFFPEQT